MAIALLCGTWAFADEVEGVTEGEEHEHSYAAGKCEICGDVLSDYLWYYGGTGTAYSISTGEEMAALADIVNSAVDGFYGKTVILTDDVTLPSDSVWTPIGKAEKMDLYLGGQTDLDTAVKTYTLVYDNEGNSYSGSVGKDKEYSDGVSYFCVIPSVFSGTFDGGGHSICGLNVSTDIGYAGLFGNVDGTLKDFTVKGNVTYTGDNGDYIGGVTGMLSVGGTISGVTADVKVVAIHGYNVGGIAGFVGTTLSGESSENTVIIMCVNEASVTGYNKVGGIVGENAGVITQCANTGMVDGLNSNSKNGVGGIAGRNGNNHTALESGTISSCYNTGRINSRVTAVKWSGGIAGFSNSQSTVENCYSTTCPAKAESYTNPIVGYNESNLGGNNYTLKYSANIDYTGSEELEIGIRVTEEELKAMAGQLGEAYMTDYTCINDGYPIFVWQAVPASECVVTLDNLTGPDTPATVTGLVSGDAYSGSLSFSVYCDLACAVAYSMDGGKTYTCLTAATNDSGGYDFTVELLTDTAVAVVLKGDLNLDGTVNSTDAKQIQRYKVGLRTLTKLQEVATDVNADGTVNSTDAKQIQRFKVGLRSFVW